MTDAIEKIFSFYEEDIRRWGDLLNIKPNIKPEEQTTVDAARAELAALREENAALKGEQALHDQMVLIEHERTIKADKAWQVVHNKPDTFPDLGVLIDWLMEERDRLRDIFAEAKWIEFNNDIAWQVVLGGWNVYERDGGGGWEFVEQINNEAALGQEDAGGETVW